MRGLLIPAALFCQDCVYHELPQPVNCNDHPITIEVLTIEETECGLMQGTVEVIASGGSGTYQYRINEGESQPGAFFSDLGAGLYEITASDDYGCESTIEVTIKNKDGLNLEFETVASGCSQSDGSIRVIPVDGVAPYLFKINNGTLRHDSVFSHLSQGQYIISVIDSTGCEVSQTLKLRSGISFSEKISPIITENCIVSGCHNGTQFPDFRVFQNIRDNAVEIKNLVVTRIMPEDGELTQAEITAIVCWVDDGAPEN